MSLHGSAAPINRLAKSMLVGLTAVLALACGGARQVRTLPAAAPAPPRSARAAADAGARIPLDPAVLTGKLDNGLTYFIRANHKPENRAELRLVVNAGSTLEDDDQRGLAHFLEHMAFNGTEHFAKQELINYLERIGMRFGPDINAYTDFDETVYMLQVPTDDPAILGTAFEILEDWGHGVLLEDAEIDKERGVVVEEWRQGRGASGRIRDKQLPVVFHGSRYAERIVIGDKATIETAPYDVLRRFYRDWYRPDLMAVVAVGDFEPQAIEALLRQHFSRIAPRTARRERVEFPIPDHGETLFSVVTDPEATSISVSVGYKRPKVSYETVADFRQLLVDGLYHSMMSARLRELSQKADPPFQYAFAGPGDLGRTRSIYRLSAGVRDGGALRGLETLLTEARRVERYGFTQTEIDRMKAEFLRGMESQYDERDKLESDSFAAEYVQHFLEGVAAPSIDYVLELARRVLPDVSLAEVNARAGQWISNDNRVILASGPSKVEAGIPDEAALLAVFEAVQRLETTPWVDQQRNEPLVAEQPRPGRIVAEEALPDLGVTRWRLSNGVTVLLKPTDYQNDEVVLRAYRSGGYSLAPDAQALSAEAADDIVAEMGAGAFSQIELRKALSGKVVSLQAFIGELSEGLRGGASPRDLDTLFELAYLRFTGAREDSEAWRAYLKRTEGQLQNQEASPGFAFNRKFTEVLTLDHPRRRPMTVERLGQLDLAQALAFYRQRFGDASEFLFTLVGNLDLVSIRPRVEKWLGGLPSAGGHQTWRDVGVENPAGVVKFEVRKGIEPKSQVRITFHGAAEWSALAEHRLESVADVLRIRLREVLREDMGGVYGVGVFSSLSREPRQRYGLTVAFGCDPARVDGLIAAVFGEIESLKRDGPASENVAKVREIQTRERETALQRNSFWAAELEDDERHGTNLREILKFDELVAAVTEEALRDAARRYLDTERYVQGVLYPERP